MSFINLNDKKILDDLDFACETNDYHRQLLIAVSMFERTLNIMEKLQQHIEKSPLEKDKTADLDNIYALKDLMSHFILGMMDDILH